MTVVFWCVPPAMMPSRYLLLRRTDTSISDVVLARSSRSNEATVAILSILAILARPFRRAALRQKNLDTQIGSRDILASRMRTHLFSETMQEQRFHSDQPRSSVWDRTSHAKVDW